MGPQPAGPDAPRRSSPARIRPLNRAAVLYGPGDLRLESRRIPEVAADQVLVEILAVGVCGSDLHYYKHGRIGSRVVRAPLVLGHEACGRIVAVGAEVAGHRAGDRISIEPGVPCGRCPQCRRGHYNLCPEIRFNGSPPDDGALSTYLAVDGDFAHLLPDGLSDDAGALIEPLAVSLWACRAGRIGAGQRVLITGAGPVGLCVAKVAQALGAAEVLITDVNPQRLAAARRLGCGQAVDPRSTSPACAEPRFDALIECSGAAGALGGALDALAPGAVVVLVGMGEETVSLPVDLLQRRELWVTGTFRYANMFPAAIALAASGAVDLDGLVTHHFGLAHAADAITCAQRDPATLKVIITPATGS